MYKGFGVFKRVQYNSPVILTFSLLSFLVVCYAMLSGNQTITLLLFSVYRSSPLDPLFYLRLVTHVLGHTGFEHFFNNFLIILMAGPLLEEKYGSVSMIIMMFVTALVTGISQVILFNTALLGASGIVFMLILLSSFVNLRRGRIPLTLLLCVVVFIGREVFAGVMGTDSTSQFAHIIGGVCGAVLGFVMNRKKLVEPDGSTDAIV